MVVHNYNSRYSGGVRRISCSPKLGLAKADEPPEKTNLKAKGPGSGDMVQSPVSQKRRRR
jgi:hypothetical protein